MRSRCAARGSPPGSASRRLRGGLGSTRKGLVLALRTGLEVLNSNIVVIASVFLAWVVLARPLETLSLGRLAEAFGPDAGGSPRV